MVLPLGLQSVAAPRENASLSSKWRSECSAHSLCTLSCLQILETSEAPFLSLLSLQWPVSLMGATRAHPTCACGSLVWWEVCISKVLPHPWIDWCRFINTPAPAACLDGANLNVVHIDSFLAPLPHPTPAGSPAKLPNKSLSLLYLSGGLLATEKTRTRSLILWVILSVFSHPVGYFIWNNISYIDKFGVNWCLCLGLPPAANPKTSANSNFEGDKILDQEHYWEGKDAAKKECVILYNNYHNRFCFFIKETFHVFIIKFISVSAD